MRKDNVSCAIYHQLAKGITPKSRTFVPRNRKRSKKNEDRHYQRDE